MNVRVRSKDEKGSENIDKTIEENKKTDFTEIKDFTIPENIQKIINERGFYVYKWLTINDFGNSFTAKFCIFVFIVLVLGMLGPLILIYNYIHLFIYLLVIIFIFLLALVCYFFIFSNFHKNKYIFITNKYILLNGKLLDVNKVGTIKNIVNKAGYEFGITYREGNFFDKNNFSFIHRIFNKIIGTIKTIPSTYYVFIILICIPGLIISLFYILTTKYLIFCVLALMPLIEFVFMIIEYEKNNYLKNPFLKNPFALTKFIYKSIVIIAYTIILIIGSFTIVPILYFFSSLIYRIFNRKLFTIMKLFDRITDNSIKLKNDYKKLILDLNKAKNNSWRDGLLLEINKGLEEVGKLSKECADDSKKLRTTIEKSKYKEMYDFKIYDKWLQEKIYEPIEKLESILENNKNSLIKAKSNLEKQLKVDAEKELKGGMELQLKRVESTLENIDKNLQKLGNYKSRILI